MIHELINHSLPSICLVRLHQLLKILNAWSWSLEEGGWVLPPPPRPPLGLVSLFSKSLALFKLEPGEVRIRFVLFSLTTFQNTLVLIQIM